MRRVGQSLSALLFNRFELFTVELQEEKLRLLSLLLWIGIALALAGAGIFIAILTFAFWLWSVTGYLGMILLVAVLFAVTTGIVMRLRHKLQTGPTPFSQTVEEFRKDGACLRNKN